MSSHLVDDEVLAEIRMALESLWQHSANAASAYHRSGDETVADEWDRAATYTLDFIHRLEELPVAADMVLVHPTIAQLDSAVERYNHCFNASSYMEVLIAISREYNVRYDSNGCFPVGSQAAATAELVLHCAEYYAGVANRQFAPPQLLKLVMTSPRLTGDIGLFLAGFDH